MPRASHADSPAIPASERVPVARLVLDYLKMEGVTAVFGIPGGPATPLFDALRQEPGIRTVAARHECGAAFMAAGYARASGGLGVCCLTTGPGTTNAVTGIAAAKADALPVLVLSAQVATPVFGKGSLQDSTPSGADTVEMLRPVTKMSASFSHPDNARTLLSQALHLALSGRRGPVHVNIPTDIMRRETARPSARDMAPWRPAATFDRRAVREAAELLLEARRPAILAGHGVNLSRAQEELLELADLLEIPVATTPKGKGAFPEAHELSLRVFGLASSPLAESYLLSGEVDVLFVIGSSLHENSTQGWDPRLRPRRALIQQDVDPAAIGRNYPADVAMEGDSKTTLRELIFQIRRLMAHGEHPIARELDFPAWKSGVAAFLDPAAMGSGARPIKPQRLMRDLDAALPDDAVVFADIGNHTLWAVHYLTASGRRVFAHNWGEFAAMGYGVAGAVGAKLARPEKPVVAVVGDGGFAMAGMEVSTAATHRVPVVWIVFNDGRLNAVHQGQTLQYEGRTIGTEFRRIDVAAVARGLGAAARRIEDPEDIAPALSWALASDEPVVLDVRIDAEEISPIHSRIKTLGMLFAGQAA